MRMLEPAKHCAWLLRRNGEVKNCNAVERTVDLSATKSIKCSLNRPLWVIFNARRLEENTQIYLAIFSRVFHTLMSIGTTHICLKVVGFNLSSPKGGTVILDCEWTFNVMAI